MLKWSLLLTSLLFLLSGCFQNDVKAPASNEQNQPVEKKGELETTNDEKNSEEQPSQGQTEEAKEPTTVPEKEKTSAIPPSSSGSEKITQEEAVQRVQNYLNIKQDEDTIIEYDHSQENKYVVHVYDIVDKGNNTKHTATRGWYYVDKTTGKIESMF